MKKTGLPVTATIGLLIALFAVATGWSDDKPNIILIFADDLGYGDLGCYGQTQISTPNIDRLATEGMKWTQAYAGSPVCTASRAALMTGLHNGHSAARDNIPHYDTYLRDSDVTIAELLSQAGYRCGGVGKWSLGDAGTIGRATRQGFDMWLGYLNQDHAHYYYTDYLDDNEGRLELPQNSSTKKQYSHDLLVERSIRFIQESKDGPFFLYAAFTLPHFSSSKEDATRLPVPSDAPYTNKAWAQIDKNYAAMITMLDRDVGRIADTVDQLGLSDQTLILITSDNGPWGQAPERFNSNGPLRGAKRDLYEGGIRVPMIARWPGTVPADSTNDELIASWDLLPTFCSLAKIDPPSQIDGISMEMALRGAAIEESHEYLYWDYGHCRSRYDRAVRLGHWKAVSRGRDRPIELYDLSRDLGEKHDVADQHPKIVQQIANVMSQAVTSSDRYPVGKVYNGSPKWRPPKRRQANPRSRATTN